MADAIKADESLRFVLTSLYGLERKTVLQALAFRVQAGLTKREYDHLHAGNHSMWPPGCDLDALEAAEDGLGRKLQAVVLKGIVVGYVMMDVEEKTIKKSIRRILQDFPSTTTVHAKLSADSAVTTPDLIKATFPFCQAAMYLLSDLDKESLASTIQGGEGGDSTIAFCMVKESKELLEVLWPLIEAQTPDEVDVEGHKVAEIASRRHHSSNLVYACINK